MKYITACLIFAAASVFGGEKSLVKTQLIECDDELFWIVFYHDPDVKLELRAIKEPTPTTACEIGEHILAGGMVMYAGEDLFIYQDSFE